VALTSSRLTCSSDDVGCWWNASTICIRLSASRIVHRARPFELLALAVLPDHLHCVWRLPEGDADNANRWAQIETGFSRRLPIGERRSPSRTAKHEADYGNAGTGNI